MRMPFSIGVGQDSCAIWDSSDGQVYASAKYIRCTMKRRLNRSFATHVMRYQHDLLMFLLIRVVRPWGEQPSRTPPSQCKLMRSGCECTPFNSNSRLPEVDIGEGAMPRVAHVVQHLILRPTADFYSHGRNTWKDQTFRKTKAFLSPIHLN